MEDIAPKLLKLIQDDFTSHFDKSDIISSLYAKVRDGTATYVDANEFAIEVGELLANAYQRNISSSVLPDGKMYYNIGKRVIEPTMVHNYDLITGITQQIQTSLNKAANIGIKARGPKLNRDRINGMLNRLSSEDNYDNVAWILNEPVKTFSQSIVDDSIHDNAEFHHNAGMQPKIIRKLAGGCCEWCRAVAGTYKYPDVPKDVYRRHQRCRCIVEYYPGDGKVQNVHTKKTRNETVIEKSKQRSEEDKINAEVTKRKRTFNEVPPDKVVEVMRKDSEKWVKSLSDEEIRCIQKYTLNDGDKHPKFYERLNAMLRGDLPEDETLRYYAETISNALKRNKLGENIICYRGVDVNPFTSYKAGEYLSFHQFTSTSVKSSNAFKKPVRIVIYASKGTSGAAYIELISKFPKQRELLFDKDCVYKVLSNKEDLIELEVF